jgi:hypothetical protein
MNGFTNINSVPRSLPEAARSHSSSEIPKTCRPAALDPRPSDMIVVLIRRSEWRWSYGSLENRGLWRDHGIETIPRHLVLAIDGCQRYVSLL